MTVGDFIVFQTIYNKIRMKFKKNTVMKRDNFSAINELREMLGTTKKLALESFIMPEEDDSFVDTETNSDETIVSQDTVGNKKIQGDVSNIEKELIEIRKIALNVINRLADQTTSESYDTMKRIWSLVDKAIESKNAENRQNNNNHEM